MWKLPFKLPIKKFSYPLKKIILWGLFIFYSIIIISYYYFQITEGLEPMDLSKLGLSTDSSAHLNGNTVVKPNVADGPGIVMSDVYSNTKVPTPVNNSIGGNTITSSPVNNMDFKPSSGGNLINPSQLTSAIANLPSSFTAKPNN